jgi:signal transduction histidine kinase
VHPAPASQPFATTYAPVISITSVTQNAHKVTIKGTGPKRDSKRVEVFANDTLLGETGLNSSGEWQLVVTDFTPGSYSITAKWSADDAAVGFVPMMNLNQAQNPHEIISKISIVDMSDGATLKELFMPEGYAAISVSPAHNGKAYILAMNMNISTSQGTDKVSVIEYDLATGRLVKLFEARAPDSYAQMRINPAGDALYLLTATDLSVYSFGGIRQQRIPVSMAAGGTITAAALFYRDMVVSEDGKTILLTTWFSYGVDNVTTHIFNLENGTHSTRSDTGLTGGSKEQMTNSFTVGAKAYIVYSGGAVQELNTATGEVLNTYDLGLSDDSGAGGYESVLSAAYSSQHKSLIASVVIVDNGSPRSYHYQIREINVETGVVEVFSVPVGSWRILAQSPNNKSLFFLPSSMAVNDMSTEFSKKVHTFDLQNRVFTESAFDLDGIVLPYSTSPQMLLSNAVFTGTANATVVPYAVTPPTNPGTPTNPGGTDTSSEGPGQSVSVIGGSQGTIVPNQPAPQQSELIPEVAQTFVQKQREKFGIAERSRDRQDHGLVAGIARVLGVAPVTVVRVFPWFILLSLIILLIIALIQLLQRILFARKMKRMVARQELLNHEKKSLLSLASHYLRTPLTLVSAGVDLLPQESTARKNISSASTSLAEVVQRIIESIATDNDLSAITKPIQTQYQRTSLMRPRILIPALLSMSLIAAVNIVAVYGVNLSPGFAHIAAQVVAWCALVGGLYVLYDARDQQKEVHRYHQQLLAHEESLDRARNNFVQSVSEDLTPAVMAVDSAIPLGLPDETTRYLKEGLRQLESLLQNFLLIGQLEQRALKQRARSVSLKSSINAAKDASAHPDVMVRSRVDATSSVEQPESLLRRVFGSLIDNAAEHSPDDQLIEVVSENTKHGVEVAFKDRGEGIAPEKLSLLFKPLSRVESAEDFTHQGMGFSLYVNRLIMHYLGGEISAQSKVGQGTTVKVKVPTQFSAAG